MSDTPIDTPTDAPIDEAAKETETAKPGQFNKRITLGTIVLYYLSSEDVEKIHSSGGAGNHNPVTVDTPCAAIVVSCWEGNDITCNLRVFLDGEGSLWKTSVPKGFGPGCWMRR